MDAMEVIKLFDSCWFEQEILKKPSNSGKKSNFEANPDHKNEIRENPSRISSSVLRRSMSDELSSQTRLMSDSESPDSVLLAPNKLHTIPSGKEMKEENKTESEFMASPKRRIGSRRKQKRGCKSHSELEFEELKGFMDLGFVFSEEDNKDSNLVSIVPGLQRLGKKNESSNGVSRPYLSEAWEVMEKEKPLMNWRIPSSFANEIDMKHNLRWWAHTVASTVR